MQNLHPTFSLTIKTIPVMFSVRQDSEVVKILIMQTWPRLHGILGAYHYFLALIWNAECFQEIK